jgi:hypothetical protein
VSTGVTSRPVATQRRQRSSLGRCFWNTHSGVGEDVVGPLKTAGATCRTGRAAEKLRSDGFDACVAALMASVWQAPPWLRPRLPGLTFQCLLRPTAIHEQHSGVTSVANSKSRASMARALEVFARHEDALNQSTVTTYRTKKEHNYTFRDEPTRKATVNCLGCTCKGQLSAAQKPYSGLTGIERHVSFKHTTPQKISNWEGYQRGTGERKSEKTNDFNESWLRG